MKIKLKCSDYIILILSIVAFFYYSFFGFKPISIELLARPLTNEGDVFAVQVLFDSIRNGWHPFAEIQNSNLGYPIGYSMQDYPLFDLLFLVIVKLLSIFITDVFILFNTYYMITFILSGLAFYVVVNRYSTSRLVNFCSAIIFAFLPYHFTRIHHIFLASYFMIPFMVWIAVELSRYWIFGEKVAIRKRYIVLSSFIFGITGVYYPFFFLLILLSSLFFSIVFSIRQNMKVSLWSKGRYFGLVFVPLLFAMLVNLLPNLKLHNLYDVKSLVKRDKFESEIYSLRPINLLLPHQFHQSGAFRKIQSYYEPFMKVEGYGEGIGLYAILGLSISILTLISFRQIHDQNLYIIGLLCLVSIFIGIQGGVGTLISNFVSPEIRSLNRISIFIGCLSIIASCGILSRRIFFDRGGFILAFLILAFAVWDIIPKYYRVTDSLEKGHIESRRLGLQISSAFPKGAAILQLPYKSFPETPPINQLADYELFIPYLYAPEQRYSYGHSKFHPDASKLIMMSQAPSDTANLKEAGFSGILVNKKGYSDSAESIKKEIASTKNATHIYEDEVWVLYKILE